jgi:intracellular sulfur oxidation DsrE/DsrF family protein
MEDCKKKKKPGRPKNPVNVCTQEFLGLVASPVRPEHILEFVYVNPIMLKKLFAMQRGFAVGEIEMVFGAEDIQFLSQDHLKKSRIFATIYGKCVNHYYCKETIRICVKLEHLTRIFGTLNKSINKVSFILKQDDHRAVLYVILKDGIYESEDTYEIDILSKPEAPVATVPSDENYPVRFRMESKHFKTKIASMQKLSKNLVLQKLDNHPFQMTHETLKPTPVNWTTTFGNASKIDFHCTLAATDILNVTVNIDYIRPFTNSTIGDDVIVSVHPTEPISFMTYLDKKEDGTPTCVLRVFTDITS